MALTDEAVRDLISQIKADQEALRQQLNADREAFIGAFKSLQETLLQTVTAPQQGITPTQSLSNVTTAVPSIQSGIIAPNFDPALRQRRLTGSNSTRQELDRVATRSVFSGTTGATGEDESDSGDDESFFVQQTLPKEELDEDAFRNHLKEHPWNPESKRILESVIDEPNSLDRQGLFEGSQSTNESPEKNAHGTVYDVGTDGSALMVRTDPKDPSQGIWQSLSKMNHDLSKRQAVGRIAIFREPSPVLFAAIHYAMKSHFDMDEIYKLLSDESPSKAYMMNCFEKDTRRQRSFVFCLKYYTIVGDERKPMSWQYADKDLRPTPTHIPLSTCCSVVGLSLSGDPIRTVKSKSRRASVRHGRVYDPFAPWRVLNIQCYPDWKSTVDDHESNRHYVNGPEAFLVTLITEYRDAQKRFLEINKKIVALTTPPVSVRETSKSCLVFDLEPSGCITDNQKVDFMFNSSSRDELLFEDENYTFSRRYFWAFQTLATMNDKIEDMVAAYNDTFTDDVWTGKNKLLWPGEKDQSSRFSNWRTKMGKLRKEFEQEIRGLEQVRQMNIREQRDIDSLREQLFSGTSVLESRKSVEQTTITVQQGHNIKLLTLVTIFFLPLTFTTSIFGMTNMPPDDNFVPFGIVTVIICMPTYLMIASLNTHKGYRWWQNRILDVYHKFLQFCHFIWLKIIRDEEKAQRIWARMAEVVEQRDGDNGDPSRPRPRLRTQTTLAAMAARNAEAEGRLAPRPSLSNRQQRISSIKFPDSITNPPVRSSTAVTEYELQSSSSTPPVADNANIPDTRPLGRASTGLPSARAGGRNQSKEFQKKNWISRTLSDRWEKGQRRHLPV
ncbi:putative mg2+ transporter zinc transport protein [Phaeomoniella chlamydospora]|uniref:Putative mg2+ transporter zinc transport protein n=1 Tax=Phaeomoniella chlamydospora TaxID=158046 RepID=A0A0G2DYT5_PHACM|nr:putative mg2+ transporter zinc transport protein [Phaeomoniella chlamydospora]